MTYGPVSDHFPANLIRTFDDTYKAREWPEDDWNDSNKKALYCGRRMSAFACAGTGIPVALAVRPANEGERSITNDFLLPMLDRVRVALGINPRSLVSDAGLAGGHSKNGKVVALELWRRGIDPRIARSVHDRWDLISRSPVELLLSSDGTLVLNLGAAAQDATSAETDSSVISGLHKPTRKVAKAK